MEYIFDIHRVRVNGRIMACFKCGQVIAQETVIKKRVGDKSLEWACKYICDECLCVDMESKK